MHKQDVGLGGWLAFWCKIPDHGILQPASDLECMRQSVFQQTLRAACVAVKPGGGGLLVKLLHADSD